MSEFISILTHARRLQAAVKDLSVAELEQVAEKLNTVIENKREQEAEQIRQLEKKQALKDAILKQMQEAGLDLDDLAGDEKSTGTKYRYTDEAGTEHTWTGIGRTPKVFAKLKDQGKLDNYAV